MTIIDFLKPFRNYKRFDGEIGLEIETETLVKDAYDAPLMKYWGVHEDGSLRNFGREFVLKAPILYQKELRLALEEFRDKTSHIKFLKDANSTSVHTHLNMLNETFRGMGVFMTLYTLFENLLIRYSGPDRLSNLFCLPICDAENTYTAMVDMLRAVENKQYKGMFLQEGSFKYAALNLAAFGTYGSLEVRSFEGTTDIERIFKWVSILHKMVKYSRNKTTPRELINKYRDNWLALVDEVFEDYAKELLTTTPKGDRTGLIEKNIFYAASVAYSVKDWDSLDVEKVEKLNLKQKDLEALAQHFFKVKFSDLLEGEVQYMYDYVTKNGMPKLGKTFINKPGLADVLGVGVAEDWEVREHRENERRNEQFAQLARQGAQARDRQWARFGGVDPNRINPANEIPMVQDDALVDRAQVRVPDGNNGDQPLGWVEFNEFVGGAVNPGARR